MITSTQNSHVADEPLPWTISNKYYDADVQFRIQSYPIDSDSAALVSVNNIEGVRALIYAFTNGSVSTWWLLHSVIGKANELGASDSFQS